MHLDILGGNRILDYLSLALILKDLLHFAKFWAYYRYMIYNAKWLFVDPLVDT